MNGYNALPLRGCIITEELYRRPTRPANYEAESQAINTLMQAMATQATAEEMLQSLAETSLTLCRAHSAGVSILERDETGREAFRWHAAAGQWAAYRGEQMPRESPCGTVIERDEAILMAHPERHYAYAQNIPLQLPEALLIPFHFHGKPVGTVWIISHDEQQTFDAEDLRLLTSLARFAASIYQLLSRERLAADLADTERLQEISTELLIENRTDTLYQKIIDAAAAIMRSDFASIQLYRQERGQGGELKLLAHRGFGPDAIKRWEWVSAGSNTSCGASLRDGTRVIVPDVETNEMIAGSLDLEIFRRTGIRAVQTTPLLSRDGHILGMISTHWARPHHPSERDLILFDVLARQASDLIERSMSQDHAGLLLLEVNHRAKNLLAVVQAMARQTAGKADPLTFAEQFCNRLAGIAASQDLLVQNNWQGVDAGELVRSQLYHLGDLLDSRIRLTGPSLRLTPAAAQSIGMALYELSTNSVKYGALSNDAGHIAIEWTSQEDAAEPRFLMSWQEHDGPTITLPIRPGFGHSVIVRSIEYALDASVSLVFAADGLSWRLDAPAEMTLDASTAPMFQQMRMRVGE